MLRPLKEIAYLLALPLVRKLTVVQHLTRLLMLRHKNLIRSDFLIYLRPIRLQVSQLPCDVLGLSCPDMGVVETNPFIMALHVPSVKHISHAFLTDGFFSGR